MQRKRWLNQNAVTVITGGSSGIGLATAKLFQQVGAKVAISGRKQNSLDEAVKELSTGVLAVRSDLSKRGDLDPGWGGAWREASSK